MSSTATLIHKFIVFVIDPLALLLFAAGFFLFMFGMVEFLWKMKEGQPSPEGKQHMIFGIVGMFIIVSSGGIINFLAGTFGLDLSGNTDVGTINSVNTGNFFQ